MPVDPVALAQDLIRRPSVTPADAGCMDLLERTLAPLGFVCRRLRFGEIENLYARRGSAGRNLCFAGHTDVVPVGDAAAYIDAVLGAIGGAEIAAHAVAMAIIRVSFLPGVAVGEAASVLVGAAEPGPPVLGPGGGPQPGCGGGGPKPAPGGG